MREYPVKKGLKTSVEAVLEIVNKYAPGAKVEGNTVIFSMPGIKAIRIECGRKTLDVETETDPSYEDPAKSLKMYNNMITELTGFDSKERKKRMSKV